MTNTRSTTRLWAKRLQQAARSGAFGLVVLACAQGSARAAEDDENSIWNLDTRVYQEFMSALGLKSSTGENIEYRERSPLVVPPSRSLPPPEAGRNQPPAWPVDPDQKRRKDAAAAKRNRKEVTHEIEAASYPISPSELDPPGTIRARPGTGSNNAIPGDPEGSALHPSKLGYFGGLFSWSGFGWGAPKDEVTTFTREPPRSALTAPPPGYQTPSAAAPYGLSKRIEYGKPTPSEYSAVGY